MVGLSELRRDAPTELHRRWDGDGVGDLQPLPGSAWRERQTALYSYGFVCSCSRCLDEQEEEL